MPLEEKAMEADSKLLVRHASASTLGPSVPQAAASQIPMTPSLAALPTARNLPSGEMAAAYFIVRGAVDWPAALIMIAGAIAGGYGGALFARRIGRDKARAAVIVIGLLVAGILLFQQSRR